MKAAVNGALNLSVLDGWWVEACNVNTGWAIGQGEELRRREYQDEVESNALYNLLEKELIPLFYNRGADGLPRAWISKMKTSMREICPVFNTNRMVKELRGEILSPGSQPLFIAHERKIKDHESSCGMEDENRAKLGWHKDR